MQPIKVFFLEPTDRYRLALRRYARRDDHPCAGSHGYHNAMTPIGERAGNEPTTCDGDHPHDDPRWPTQCECGYVFADEDNWQLFTDRIYRRADTGEEMGLRDAPPGAVWNASWFVEGREDSIWAGPDGRCLVARCPDGHDWMIDSRASNCTMPDDTVHKCWVRHGRPEDGTLHVDKDGVTCAAGAGSIDTGTWHGFLHNGHFTLA
jgi:hypothetical protein